MAITYEKISLGTVVGPQGPQGETGPQGPQGETGGVLSESEMDAIYMKKVADSDLDMNGYALTNISSDTVYAGFGSSRDVVHMPRITASELGVASTDKQSFFKAYFKKMVELFPDRVYIHFTGVIIIDHIYYIDGYVNSTLANNLDSEGVPLRATFSLYSYMFDVAYYWYRGSSGDFFPMTIPIFPYGDTTKDNRINASGVSEDGSSYYIRYENGFQICFGSFTKNVSLSSANGNVYSRSLSVEHLYPVSFTTVVHLSVTPSYNYIGGVYHNLWVGFNYTYTSKIHSIGISSPTPISNTDLKFDFIAIGRWK